MYTPRLGYHVMQTRGARQRSWQKEPSNNFSRIGPAAPSFCFIRQLNPAHCISGPRPGAVKQRPGRRRRQRGPGSASTAIRGARGSKCTCKEMELKRAECKCPVWTAPGAGFTGKECRGIVGAGRRYVCGRSELSDAGAGLDSPAYRVDPPFLQ